MSRLTRAEQDVFAAWWYCARQLYQGLLRGEKFTAISVSGVWLENEEACYLDAELGYARYYGLGMTAESQQYAGLSQRATATALPQWRDHCQARVIFTNRRLLCAVDDEWLSFEHETIAKFEADLSAPCFAVDFASGYPFSLLLAGPAAPAYALATAYRMYGTDALQMQEFTRLAE